MTLLLADTSVWARSSTGEVAERFNDAIARGRVAITPVVRLEVLYMAQGTAAYDRLRTSLDALIRFRSTPTSPVALRRSSPNSPAAPCITAASGSTTF